MGDLSYSFSMLAEIGILGCYFCHVRKVMSIINSASNKQIERLVLPPCLPCFVSYLHPSSGLIAALVTAAAGRNHVYLSSKDVQGRFPFCSLPWHFESMVCQLK